MTLPRVPLDSSNERQHRTVLATAVNELVKVRPPNDRTEAEVAAGVTPVDQRYPEGDDRRYNTLADWCSVISQGVEGHLWTDRTIASELSITGDAIIIVHGFRSITATATMNRMLRHSGRLTLVADGELLFDGDNRITYACLHSTNYLPSLKNVRFLDATNGGLGGDSDNGETFDDLLGDAILENVTAENCADAGWAYRGHQTAASRTATITLRNCKTKGTTGSGDLWGSGIGFLFHVSGMARVRWEGGDFTGDSGANCTNAYECTQVEIEGGYYHDVLRGATIGRNCQNFVIKGVVGKALSVQGVSADTTTGVGETVGIGVVDGCVVSESARVVRTTCSNVSITNCHGYNNTAVGDFVFAGEGTSVWVHGNSSFRDSTSFVAFSATESTSVTYGVNFTNSTNRQNYSSTSFVTSQSNHLVPCGEVRTVTANTDLRGSDRMIVADTTAGDVDVDLFDASEVRATGFTVAVAMSAGANSLTVTFQGGAVNGETIITPTGSVAGVAISQNHKGQRWAFECIDGPAGTWIGTPPGLSYINSAATTFNPSNLADGAGEGTDITVTGAALGDFAVASFSNDTQEILLDAQVTASNTVTVRFQNETTGALDLASGSIRVMVWRQI